MGARIWKRVWLAGCLACLGLCAQAQTAYPDLIVKQNGDTIRCAFRSFTDDMILYFRTDSAERPIKAQIAKAKVAYHEKDYFAKREAMPGAKPRTRSPLYYERGVERASTGNAGPGAFVRLEAGLGLRSQAVPYLASAAEKDFLTSMQSGLLIGGSIGRLFNSHFGFALHIERMAVQKEDAAARASGKVRTLYAGVELMARAPIDRNGPSAFYATLGAGAMHYRTNIYMPSGGQHDSGIMPGARLGLGLDIQLSGPLCLNLGGNLVFAKGLATSYTEKNTRGGATLGLSLFF